MILALSASIVGARQSLPVRKEPLRPLPPGWELSTKPKDGSDEWFQANGSTREWHVEIRGDQLVIDRFDAAEGQVPLAQSRLLPFKVQSTRSRTGNNQDLKDIPFDYLRAVVSVENGWILGFNAGEWGGGLYWFSQDGKHRRRILTEAVPDPGGVSQSAFDLDNVTAILPHEGRLFVFLGLNHLFSDFGRVIEATQAPNGKWRTRPLANLGSQPLAVIPEGHAAWIVLTWKGLFRISDSGVKRELYPGGFMAGLYPNSMVKTSDGLIYIGMRQFVARLVPEADSYRCECLVPVGIPHGDR